jgi:hypothetical protein
MQFSPSLPKTRSGKIMRRIPRKFAEDDFGVLGTRRRWPIQPSSMISSIPGRTGKLDSLFIESLCELMKFQ